MYSLVDDSINTSEGNDTMDLDGISTSTQPSTQQGPDIGTTTTENICNITTSDDKDSIY